MKKAMWIVLLVSCIGTGISTGVYLYSSSVVEIEKLSLYPSSPVNWREEDQSFKLDGRLIYPANFKATDNRSAVILFHGVYRSLDDNVDLGRQLAAKGVVCLCISFRGHGGSGGTFPFDNGSAYNATFGDANGAFRWLVSQKGINPDRLGVSGQSLGGGAALYLALEGLISSFVLWYPGTAYFWGVTPLYEYFLPSQETRGLIIQGTADDCARCSPEFTQYFVDRNTGANVKWIEGGGHGSGIHHQTYLGETIQWFVDRWNLSNNGIFLQSLLLYPYSALIILGITVIIDLGIGLYSYKKSRGK